MVGGEVDIRSRRYDEKCNGDESLFSIPAAMRLGAGEVSGHSFALILRVL